MRPSIVLFLALLMAVTPRLAQAQAPDAILCRISTENNPNHFQTRTLKRFSELVAERSKGSLQVEFHDSGTLFRDANAVGAITRGDLEMAALGIWQLDKLVPDTAVLMLPSLYAKPVSVQRAIVDGAVGITLSRNLEASMRAVVLGPWLDLGFGHIFGAAVPIRSIADIKGKRIRVAGGRGNEERVRALGGTPVSIALLDLPSYLERALVDGLLTTYETINSGELDRRGIKSVLEDAQYYPFYVPVVSAVFWSRIDEQQRSILRSAWADVVTWARGESVRAQEEAKQSLVKRGLKVYSPKASESSRTRASLIATEGEMAMRLNISAGMLALLRQELGTITRP
jgi:TRAP-type C4-dicarboxylate transport system substrate-binding protein